jgi:dihydroneopterin aldolase
MSALMPLPPLPQHDASGAALDLVFIEGLTLQTVIGIHHSELHDPQPVRVDLAAGLPRSGACDSDRIVDTIDYAVLRERLHKLFAEHRVQLLEALAEEIARITVCEFGAHWVRVTLAKPRKFEDLQAVGVAIERRATDFDCGAARARAGARVLSLIAEGMVPGKK